MVTSSLRVADRLPRSATQMGVVQAHPRSYCRGMPSAPALVGRDVEFAQLVEWVEDLISGTGRAVLIEGEPGIGKSFLARTVAATSERRGCQVYRAAADELGQELPLQ